jgi:molybdate transport system ATP-binding protein
LAEQLSFRIRLRRDESFKLDVNGAVPLDGVTAITGPSGGGKTTLLRVLAGLEPEAAARITLGTKMWEGDGVFLPPEARRVGFVFQDPYLFPHLTAGENLAYGARRREVKKFDAIVEALDLDRLMTRNVAGLSGGEAQRVALGRALAADPAVLFLDEPLANLDPARKDELLPYIARAVIEAKVPAIYVSHATDEITALADRVLGLSGGTLTGWHTPPMRLIARVIATDDRTMRLRLIGAPETGEGDITQPLRARVGERVGLGLPRESMMLSATRPEAATALAILPAGVVPEDDRLELDIWGQRLSLPHAMWNGTGARLWLSILRVMLRPEGPDSRI